MFTDKIRIICPTGECKNCVGHVGRFDPNCYGDKNLQSDTWLFYSQMADGSICFVRIPCPQFSIKENPDGSCNPLVTFWGQEKEWEQLAEFIQKIAPAEVFKNTDSVCFKKTEDGCILAYSDEIDCIIPQDDLGNITIMIKPKIDTENTDPNYVPPKAKTIELTRVRCEDVYGYEFQQGSNTVPLNFTLGKSNKTPGTLVLFDAKGREQEKGVHFLDCLKDNLNAQDPLVWGIDCDKAKIMICQNNKFYEVTAQMLVESCDILTDLVKVYFDVDANGDLQVCADYLDENGNTQTECGALNMSADVICQYIVNDCISADANNMLTVGTDGKLYVPSPLGCDWQPVDVATYLFQECRVVVEDYSSTYDDTTGELTILITYTDWSTATFVHQLDQDNTVTNITVVDNWDWTATLTYVLEDGTIINIPFSLTLLDCNCNLIPLNSYKFQECRIVVASYTENYNPTTWDVTTVVTYTDWTTWTFIHPTDTDNTVTNITVVDNGDGTAILTYTLEDGTIVNIPFSLTIRDCNWILTPLAWTNFVTEWDLASIVPDTAAPNPMTAKTALTNKHKEGHIWREGKQLKVAFPCCDAWGCRVGGTNMGNNEWTFTNISTTSPNNSWSSMAEQLTSSYVWTNPCDYPVNIEVWYNITHRVRQTSVPISWQKIQSRILPLVYINGSITNSRFQAVDTCFLTGLNYDDTEAMRVSRCDTAFIVQPWQSCVIEWYMRANPIQIVWDFDELNISLSITDIYIARTPQICDN